MKGLYSKTRFFRKLFLVAATFIIAIQVNAQHGWTFNVSDYFYSANRIAIVLLDGVEVTDGTVGAFVGDECRGFVNDTLFPPTGKHIFDWLVFSNQSTGETMNFKYYNPDDGIIYDITETLEFNADNNLGFATNPIIFNAISNDPPTVDSPITDQSLDEYFGSTTIDLSTVFSDPDLDALTYSATSSSGSVVTVSVSSSILTITEEGLGTSTVTVTADDGLATTDDVFTVTVNNVNDAPVVVNPIANISPNEGFGSTDIDLSATFNDKDGDAMTYTAVSSNTGVVTVSVDGNTLTVTEVAPGISTVTVTASDGTLTGDDDFEVNVNNVNDAPVVSAPISDQTLDEYFATEEINLAGVFTDPDGDALTLTPSSSNPTVVTAGITGLTLTLTEVGLGSSTITITASDGSLSVQDVFTVTVNNVNDAPVVDNPIPNQNLSEYFATENIDISSTFSDPDGDDLTYSAVSSNTSVVTVNVAGNSLIITEVGQGTATITLTADDSDLTTDDVFTVNVANVNDAPIVANPIPNQSEDEYFGSTTIALATVFFDQDGDALTLTPSSSNPTVVTVGITGTTLTINEVGLGTSTITINASDGSLSVNDVFTFTVDNVNDAPEVANPVSDQDLNEFFTTFNINLSTTFTDPDGDVLTLTASSDTPGVVTASVTGTTLTLTEAGLGTAIVTVTASDGTLTANDQFIVNVNNVNEAPEIASAVPDQVYDEYFGSDDINIAGVFTDPDGDVLSYSAVSSQPSVVTVTVSGTTLTINEVGLGSANITLTASDGSLNESDVFQVIVNNVNDDPVVDNPVADQILNEGFGTTNINLSSTFSDPDGDALTLSAVSNDITVVTVNVTATTLTITEVGLGTATVTVTATDGTLSVNDQFAVDVNNVNDPPVVDNPVANQSLDEGFTTTNIDISNVFSDPDGDDLTLSAVSSNTGVVTASVTGTTLTLTEVGLGNANITVTASDGTLSTNDQFSVAVNNVNDPPEVVNAITDRSYDEGFGSATVNLSSVFSDPDGDVLTLSALSGNTGIVTVSVSGSILTITEVGLGNTTVTVTASDGALSVIDVFNVTVNNVNDAPVVDNPIPNQSEDEYFGSSIINLASVFSDPDGDALDLTAASSNTSIVTVSISGTTLTITEQGLGTASITVTASDGSLSVNDIFTFTVVNVNDAPEVSVPLADLNLDEYFGTDVVSLVGVFTDPDGDDLTYTATSSDESVVTVAVLGSSLTITEVGLGASIITVTASDGSLTDDDQFIVNVINVNENPVVAVPIPDVDLDEYFSTTSLDLSGTFTDPDGDNLTLTAVSGTPGVVTVSITGTTLTITEVGLGSSNITVTATDNGEGNLTVNDIFVVRVNNVNDPPVVISPITDRNANEYFTSTFISLAGVFSDPDGDNLTLTAVSGSPGVVTVSVSGNNLTINEVGLGTSTITVTATDDGDGNLSTIEEFDFTVNNLNDAPVVANPIANQVYSEGFSAATINLTNTFSDKDNDPLTLSAVSSNNGIVTVSVSGTTLTITEQGIGIATVTVSASDGTLGVSDQFQVTVNNVNDAPVVENPIANRTFDEGFGSSTVSLGPVFSDPDGDPLFYSVFNTNPLVATVSISGTTLTISEVGLGSTSVVVTASDGILSIQDAFDVTVNNVNDAPVVDNPIATQNLNEYFGNTTLSLANVFSDPDVGDNLTLSASSSNTGVVTVSVTGTTLTINEVGLGSAIITVTATDDGSPSLNVSDQFNLNVNNVNDAPEVVNPIANQSYDEYFSSVNIDLSTVFTDKDGDGLTLTAVSGNTGIVTVNVVGNTLTVTEVGLGTATITVTASDGSLSVSDDFTFEVNNVNDQPQVDNPIANRAYDEGFGTATISLATVFSDRDGDALTLSATSSNTSAVTVGISGSTLTITETGLGASTITVTASDGTLSINDIFIVTVNNVNDAPVVDNPISDRNLNEYFGTSNISLLNVFSDPDAGDVLTLSASSSANGVVTVNIIGSTLILTEQGLGTATITVTATDNGDGNLSVSDQFVVNVNNVNDPPVVNNPVANQVYDEYFVSDVISLAAVFSDKDLDVLTLSAVSSNPAVVGVSVSGTNLTITEAGLGNSTVTVTASDGTLSVDDQFTVTVNNVNDAPALDNPIANQTRNEYFSSATIDLSSVFSDKDGDVILLSALSSNNGIVTVSVSGSNLIVQEAGLGTATITVTASDGSLSTDDQFTFTVNNVNDAPVVDAPLGSISNNEGFGSTNIDLSPVFIDPDGDGMTYTATSSNVNVVTVNVSGSTLIITEVGLGSSLITVTATDGTLSTNDQFTFAIDNVNDPPEVVQPIGDRDYDEGFGSASINLATIFSDPDGDVLSFNAVSNNTSVATVSISGSTLTISEVGLGFATITVTASDGTLTNDDLFLVSVNNVNDAPVLDNPLPNVAYDEYFASATVNLNGVFSDPDGDGLSLSATSSNSGVVTVNVSGTTLTITEVGLGNSTITVTASDGLLIGTDQFTVTVNNVNDAPEVISPLANRSYQEGFGSAGITLAPVFTDQDGDVLTLTATSSNNGIVTVSISGSTLTITETGLGTATITVTASDGTLSVNDQFNVTVDNVNDAPEVANPISDRILNEHFGTLDIPLASVFTDPDAGDVLTLSAVSSNTSVVTVSVTGTTLTLTETGLGTTTITVTAEDDGDGNLSVTDEFTVTVNNVNDPPEVDNPIPNQSLEEYFGTSTIELAGVFSDPDVGDVLSLSAVSSAPGVVTVSISGTTLTITEVGLGNASITVTATDGTLSIDDQFGVSVGNVNDAPEVDNPVPNQVEDEYFGSSAIDLSAVFSDKDGDALTLSAVSNNTGVVSVNLSGTTLTITEEGLGTATITVTASDGFLGVDDVFTFTVNNVNDPPVVDNPVANRNLNEYFGSSTINLASVFSDKDGDGLTLSAVSSDTDVVTVGISGSILTITEAGLGSSTVTITASDGSLSVSDEFTVTVNNVNDAPVVDNAIANQSLNEYFGSVNISLANVFEDKDGDDLTLTAVSNNNSVVTVSISGTTLIITEVGLGTAAITVTATDGSLSVDDQFNVVVNNVNDAPEVLNPVADQEVDEHFISTTIELAGVFTDKDGDDLTLSASSSNTGVVTVSVSGTTLTISEVDPGVSLITVTASDGDLSVNNQFTFTMINVNDPPEVVNPLGNLSLNEYFGSTTVNLNGVFDDPDGNVITFTANTSDPSVVTVGVAGTTLTLTEVGLGVANITVTASDGTLSTEESFTVSIDNVNDSPEILVQLPDLLLIEYFGQDTTDLVGVFNDPDVGDELTITASSSNTDVVTVSVVNDSLFITEVNYGESDIMLTASDGELSVDMHFKVTVENTNDAPVLVNPIADLALVDNLDSVNIDITDVFMDPDGDTLTYSFEMLTEFIVWTTLTDSTIIFEPRNVGFVDVILTASDTSLSTSDTITIEVIREIRLNVFYNDEDLDSGDSILVCEDPDAFELKIGTTLEWSAVSNAPSWLVVNKEDDETLTVGYSANLTGDDRKDTIIISDTQGHRFEVIVKQSASCVSSVKDFLDLDYTIYPNPVTSVLYIDMNGVVEDDVRLEVLDGQGRLLYHEEVKAHQVDRIEVDMGDYKEGMYFIRISNQKYHSVDKVVKQ